MPRRLFAAALIGLAGCGRSQPAEPPAVAAAPAPTADPAPPAVAEVKTEAKVEQPAPPPPPPVFTFPADAAGQAVAKVVVPAGPPLPADRGGTAPKARTVPAAVTAPEAVEKPAFRPPPLTLPRAGGLKLVPPRETVPVDLGLTSQNVPAKPTLPAAVVPTPRARDVNQPPDLPILGRPLTDRASLDDPTADLGREAIVAPRVGVPLAPSPFVRTTVPDPFELGEQVKPKVPADATPVFVTPQRPK